MAGTFPDQQRQLLLQAKEHQHLWRRLLGDLSKFNTGHHFARYCGPRHKTRLRHVQGLQYVGWCHKLAYTEAYV